MSKPSRIKIKRAFKKATKKELNKSQKIKCPKCKNLITIKPGQNTCPICGRDIDFHLKF